MDYILETIGYESTFLFRILAAMILGGLVGMERQTRGRAAGLRTNILVCMGSAAVIVAFQKISLEFSLGDESVIRMDPARTAAGVITGIGFLGAGTIIKSKEFVRGLTTAASIWVVSAVGVIVGLGEYTIATVLTILVLISLYALNYLPIKGDHYFPLRLKWTGGLDLLTDVFKQLSQEGVQIKNRSLIREPKTGYCQATLLLRMRKEGSESEIFERLQADLRFDEVKWN